MTNAKFNDCYNSFCPVAKACEVLAPRWTMLILCELWQGSSRFNEIRRGVPGISPTLLSKRLKEMERNGLIQRIEGEASGEAGYATTAMADELQPVVHGFGKWAHRNIDAEITLENLDAKLLMWNMRRRINAEFLPKNRITSIQFTFPELPEDRQNYWLISKPGQPVDLCLLDPGHDVDLFIRADLKAMTSAWMGWSSLRHEMSTGKIMPIGNSRLVATLEKWMVRSSYAELPADKAAA
jgi:DNA-binding HxlR family transcriptional regulator